MSGLARLLSSERSPVLRYTSTGCPFHLFHRALYGRLPERKDRFGYDGQADCSFVSGLWCGAFGPLALMESADPRLISHVGFSLLGTIQAWRIAV